MYSFGDLIYREEVSFLIFVSLKLQMIKKWMTKSETSWYMKKKISFIDGLSNLFSENEFIENVSKKIAMTNNNEK